MNKKLNDQLITLDQAQLISIIQTLYGHNKEVDEKIDALAVQNDLSAMQIAIAKRIHCLEYDEQFIDYQNSYDFSLNLEDILDEIDKYIFPDEALSALTLIEQFLATDGAVMERVDDSMGCIGEIYCNAINLWLTFAGFVRQQKLAAHINWSERVYHYFEHNDYGLFDELIPASALLLSDDELKILACRFESEAKKAISTGPKEPNRYNHQASLACLGLQAVAEALKDIKLYEHATLLRSPIPTELQKRDFAKFSLTLKQPEQAMRWLNEIWQGSVERDRIELLEQCYQQQGEIGKLIDSRRVKYANSPSYARLMQLCDLCDKKEQARLCADAVENAAAITSLSLALELLIKLEHIAAASQLLITRHQELAELFYPDLIEYANIFVKQDNILAAILCFRTLLDDILEHGRTKAYHHAASYFNKLLALDNQLDDYLGLMSKVQYIAAVQNKHWRKHSFWQKANYANK